MSAVLIAVLLGLLFVVSNNATTASAEVQQGAVVPETARRDVPVVLDGVVFAHAQVGDRIFVGGNFQQVRTIDGNTITQPHIFAYHADTGIIDPNFRPVLNNQVRALTTSNDGNALYVGGRFSSWDDQFPLRIARLDAEGNLDTRFQARASAQVLGIEEARGSLFFAGDFLDVSGVSTNGIAKVNPITGAVDTRFTPDLGDLTSGSNLARDIVANANGSRIFVLHYAREVDGQSRSAVVSFDVATNGGAATLNGWRIPWEEQTDGRDCQDDLRAIAISPAGDFIVIGGQGADNPPNCDSVLRYPTTGNGTVNFQWSARMYSSVFSLAVSDVAVYVGGHFCAAPRNGAPPGGVTSTFPGAANQCEVTNPNSPLNPSQVDPNGAVFRNQMAALNPGNGQALAWDPGSNNDVGVFDLTLVERGLLAGHDNDRFSSFLVGRSGFFDLQANTSDTTAPQATVTSPQDGSVPGSVAQLTGTASDNRTVTDVTVRLRNRDTDQYLNDAGNFVTNNVALNAPLTATGLGEFTWSANVNRNSLPSARYQVTVFARDTFGNTSSVARSNFTIGGVAECTVSLNGQNQPVLSLSGFVAQNNSDLVVRRNNSWVATIDNDSTSFTHTSAPTGDSSYVIRWRPDGVVDVPCSPSPITVPGGGGGGVTTECTTTLNGAGNPVVSWTAIAGVSSYVVRDGDGWVATVENGTSFTDTSPATGSTTYTLRVRPAGVVLDIPCGTVTVGGGGGGGATLTCSVSLNGAGNPVITWTQVAGVDTYQVRDDDGWVATQTDDAFVDTNPGNGSRTYEIRYRVAGTVFDTTCGTVNV